MGVGYGVIEWVVGFGEGGRGGVGVVDVRFYGDVCDCFVGDWDVVGVEINVRFCFFCYCGEV